jgi:hypothetical protein
MEKRPAWRAPAKKMLFAITVVLITFSLASAAFAAMDWEPCDAYGHQHRSEIVIYYKDKLEGSHTVRYWYDNCVWCMGDEYLRGSTVLN